MTNTLSNKVVDTQELAETIGRAIDDYHDSLPQGQGETGNGSAEKGKALCQLFYDNADSILSALRTTHSPSEAEVEAVAWMYERAANEVESAATVINLTRWSAEQAAGWVETPLCAALSLPSDKTVIGDAYEALTYIANVSECEQSRKAAAEAIISIDSHLGELLEAGEPAVELLQGYIEFLHRIPADDLELHPYIPEVEEAFDRLSAAIAKAKGGAK